MVIEQPEYLQTNYPGLEKKLLTVLQVVSSVWNYAVDDLIVYSKDLGIIIETEHLEALIDPVALWRRQMLHVHTGMIAEYTEEGLDTNSKKLILVVGTDEGPSLPCGVLIGTIEEITEGLKETLWQILLDAMDKNLLDVINNAK